MNPYMHIHGVLFTLFKIIVIFSNCLVIVMWKPSQYAGSSLQTNQASKPLVRWLPLSLCVQKTTVEILAVSDFDERLVLDEDRLSRTHIICPIRNGPIDHFYVPYAPYMIRVNRFVCVTTLPPSEKHNISGTNESPIGKRLARTVVYCSCLKMCSESTTGIDNMNLIDKKRAG
jgi:hypothetical protein